MRNIFFAFLAFLFAVSLQAKVVLPKVLGSNMVLQQQSEANLWGKAEPDTKITVAVSWSKSKLRTRSDSTGNWAVKVSTPEASFTPQTITISDGEKLILDNVLIGDVWVCAGQSNMEMPVKGFAYQPTENSLEYIMSANKEANRIRMFMVKNHRSYNDEKWDCEGGEWLCASPADVAEMSAVAYFFAYNITHAVDIPIGIITADWGGTRIEAWMPMKALEEILTPEQIKHKHTLHHVQPTELYCGMIAPICNFKARGFLWYQGEANLGYQSLEYLGDIDHYDVMMARMVSQWRKDWGDENNSMPFYYAMIAPYIYCHSASDITLPLFIETQVRALDKISNSGIVATTDVGEPTCIHPAKKFEVGQRMAALALVQTYGLSGFEPKAPLYEKHELKDGKFLVYFKNASYGLAPWYDQPVKGFEICGSDRVFRKAEARAWGNKVTVWNDSVKEPVAVRYAFHNYSGEVNLKNVYGIPAIPFRTDNWNDIK